MCFTYIGGGSKFTSILIELPGCCWIHLDQSDTALTPHILGLASGEEGVQQEVHDAPGHRPRISFKARQEVLHGTDIPELCKVRKRYSKEWNTNRGKKTITFIKWLSFNSLNKYKEHEPGKHEHFLNQCVYWKSNSAAIILFCCADVLNLPVSLSQW